MSSRTVDAYLVLAKRKNGWQREPRIVRTTKHKPTLEAGECAVRVKLTIPDEAFDPVLSAPAQTVEIGDVLRHSSLQVVKP